MYTRFFLPLALLLTLFACKQDTPAGNTAAPEPATIGKLGGQWIDLDFCSRAAQYGSVLQAESNAHKPYAFAFTFNPAEPDSVLCLTSTEEWKLPIKITQDTIELLNARPGKSIFLMYDSKSNKRFTMFDATSGNGTQMDIFLKSSVNSRNGYEAFQTALNHHLFSGSFSPITAKGAAQKVIFFPEGIIEGWPEYDRYTVCTGGDCFVMGGEMDIITLMNTKKANSEQMFGFKYSGQNDTLSILNLVDKQPGEKGGYAVKNTAYSFLRKLPKK